MPAHQNVTLDSCQWIDALAKDPRPADRPGWWVARFEHVLRQTFPVADVQLVPSRRIAAQVKPSNDTSAEDELDFAVQSSWGPYTLRVRLQSGRSPQASLVADLRLAASVATLVLEAERARLPVVRAVRVGDPSPRYLVGRSDAMKALHQRIERVAQTDFTVLIEGESGSGKELVARQLHQQSRRSEGPFVAVNCAALVETLLEAELFGIEDRTATGVRGRRGKFEVADTGTLFLDEVSDLSVAAQAKLLRAIQDLAVERVGGHGTRQVDVRIVVATNRSLSALVEGGRFRADLYYRLNGIEITVPPLRARIEDVPALAEHFLGRLRSHQAYRMSVQARDALVGYQWPGNVRELERVLERAVTLTNSCELGLDELPSYIVAPYTRVLVPSLERAESLRAWASRYVRLVLARHRNNKRQACRALGISYHTLQSHLGYGTRLIRYPKEHSGTDNALGLGAVREESVKTS